MMTISTRNNNSLGFTTLEYALLLVFLIGALLAIQVPLRRAISKQWKDAADSFGSGRQYDAAATTITNN